MTSWNDRTLVEDVAASGIDDWVYEAEVYGIATRTGLTDPAQLRMLAVGLITEVLVKGLMVAGDVDDAGHHPWSSSIGETVTRIEDEWLKWGTEIPTPGAVVWLDLTPAGLKLGEAVLAREREQ
jgi:hypothetical protein